MSFRLLLFASLTGGLPSSECGSSWWRGNASQTSPTSSCSLTLLSPKQHALSPLHLPTEFAFLPGNASFRSPSLSKTPTMPVYAQDPQNGWTGAQGAPQNNYQPAQQCVFTPPLPQTAQSLPLNGSLRHSQA